MSGQLFTELPLARRMVKWAGSLKGLTVLEPSAGDGSIVRAMPRDIFSLTAFEIDQRFAGKLRALGGGGKIMVRQKSFLDTESGEAWDIAIGNPPYEDGQDVAHTAHMLTVAPRAIVLLRVNVLHLVSFHRDVLRRNRLSRVAHLVGRPAFHGPDNKGHGARHEYVVLDIRRGPADVNAHPPTSHFWQL